MKELEKILEEIEAEHPYKVPGSYDSYSQYNEAWSDAIDRVRARLENFFKEKENDGWIPVEDRLPEENVNPATLDFYEYQVTANFGFGEDVKTYKYGEGHWWNGPGIVDKYVIAWREKPDPYHPERSRENEKK